MAYRKNICLLGFSKQAEQVIKKQLMQQCSEYDFTWVSANAENLNGVIINSMFLNTPQIKKYISTIAVPCVAVYTQQSAHQIATEHGLVANPLLAENTNFDKDWISTLLLGSNDEKSASPPPSPSTTSISTSNTGKEYREIIKTIKNREPVYILATYNEKKVYLSPADRNAFINFARGDIPGIESWGWEKVDQPLHTEAMRRINIDQWLFETIWQSQTETFSIDSSMFYKLIRWPQPFSQHKRSEALRLAAQIKFHPVKLSDLVEKTHFSSELIEQFLFATHQAGQIEIVPPSQETIIENKRLDTPRNDPDRETKRGFIGKLRAKLGL